MVAWAAQLRTQYPTFVFRSASSFLPSDLQPQSKGKEKERADDALGVSSILSCLSEWSHSDQPLVVAVTGVTNVTFWKHHSSNNNLHVMIRLERVHSSTQSSANPLVPSTNSLPRPHNHIPQRPSHRRPPWNSLARPSTLLIHPVLLGTIQKRMQKLLALVIFSSEVEVA